MLLLLIAIWLGESGGANRLISRQLYNKPASAGFLLGDDMRPVFIPGSPIAECDRCGFVLRLSDLKPDGYKKGLMVCSKCYDPPHPQEQLRGREDAQAVPNARHVRTMDEVVFLNPGDVTPESL